MTTKEHGIMVDAFTFLKTFSEPPKINAPDCDDFWAGASAQMVEIDNKWLHHPLALELFPAIYSYIETKQKVQSGGKA